VETGVFFCLEVSAAQGIVRSNSSDPLDELYERAVTRLCICMVRGGGAGGLIPWIPPESCAYFLWYVFFVGLVTKGGTRVLPRRPPVVIFVAMRCLVLVQM